MRHRSLIVTLIGALTFALGGLTLSLVSSCQVNVDVRVTPPEAREGWAGSDALIEAKAAGAFEDLEEFRIVGAAGDNEKKNVRLWDAAIAVTGDHLPNYPQEIGDCVSFGAKNAIEHLQCVQMVQGPPAEFRPVFPPYLYGTSRVQIGKGKLRGDGSLGVWAAKAAQQFGVLAADHDSCPEYSGSIAKEWGRKGPPEWALSEGKQWPVRTVAQVNSADEVRDAICNGYPVTIASNFGSRNFDERDGRLVARGNGSWSHQMCILAYDGSAPSGRKYFYVLNSWGKAAHPKPLNGEPPGGFWITENQCEQIVRQGDSFAYSGFEGFPAQEIDFSIFARAEPIKEDRPWHRFAFFSLAP